MVTYQPHQLAAVFVVFHLKGPFAAEKVLLDFFGGEVSVQDLGVRFGGKGWEGL